MTEMKIGRNDWMWLGWQVAVWVILLFIPAFLEFVCNHDIPAATNSLAMNVKITTPMTAFYMINFYCLVPRFLYRRRYLHFWLSNLALFALCNLSVISLYRAVSSLENDYVLYISAFSVTFMYLFILGLATGMRYMKRSGEMQVRLQEEQKRNAEAELVWLKNQLNPHFLFNTLNNISSLVRLDADTAQDSICQLSDLLRYTLYESNKPFVPVEGEIEFMQNYIDLMKLRCNDLAKIETDMRPPQKPMRVVPLLFICLIENAFKHGVNSRMPSFIKVKLYGEGDGLVFTCENSLHPKGQTDRSGSGIGLDNLKRRLELTYPDRYEYRQETADDVYYVMIRLNDCI